jgi:hypothetical protein
MGITTASVQAWEDGTGQPNTQQIALFTKHFGFTLGEAAIHHKYKPDHFGRGFSNRNEPGLTRMNGAFAPASRLLTSRICPEILPLSWFKRGLAEK